MTDLFQTSKHWSAESARKPLGGGDLALLEAAFALGDWGQGTTWPNPSVGALIVRYGAGRPVIVGRGITQPGGRPHAERIALKQAGRAARGATMYVTLESCSHFGRTAPCADALIEAGIARVVSALEDPDPRVAGRGHEKLRAAGIAVDILNSAEPAERFHAGHISRIRRGRPHVQLKLAVSADGRIGVPGQPQVPVTGETAREVVHMMRARADAIMVGAGTVRADDPQLTVRLPGLEERSPVRVIVDSQLSTPPGARLLKEADRHPVWIVGTENASEANVSRLRDGGVDVIQVPADRDGHVSLPFALANLAARGITRLFCEGGAHLATSLAAGNLVDEWVVFKSPRILGPKGIPALLGTNIDQQLPEKRFAITENRLIGEDRMTIHWRRVE